MKKVTIEIEYDEEKDLFFHLGMVRTTIKTFFKQKMPDELQSDLNSIFGNKKFEQQSLGGNHTIEFKN